MIVMGSYFFFVMWKSLISLKLFNKKYREFLNIILLRSFSIRINSYSIDDVYTNCCIVTLNSFIFKTIEISFFILPFEPRW